MIRRGVLWGSVFIVLSLLSACQGRQDAGEPSIRFGRDTCRECKMIINEPLYAAAWVRQGHEILRFDSIECMIRALQKENAGSGAFWVHDYHSGNWIQAAAAFYVLSEKLFSPMGGGIIALGTQGEAAQMAGDIKGEMISWNELPKRRISL